jgi:hypothetical protein
VLWSLTWTNWADPTRADNILNRVAACILRSSDRFMDEVVAFEARRGAVAVCEWSKELEGAL